MNAFMKTMSEILINDLVEELSEENSRLLSHLLFANKCLLQLKTHLIDIHFKYETIISSQDKQVFKTVIQLLDSIDDKTALPQLSDSLPKRSISGSDVCTGCRQTANEDKHVIHSESSVDQKVDQSFCDYIEDSDESYVEKQTDRKRELKTRLKKTNDKKCVKNTTKLKSNALSGESVVRQWKCKHNDCGKVFTNPSALKYHRKKHGNKSLKCQHSGCPYRCYWKCQMAVHLRSHSSKPLFSCDYDDCGQSYRTPIGLQSHVVLIHTNAFYVCPVEGCERRYTTNSILKVHMKNGHSAYQCGRDGCPEVFRSKHLLKEHRVSGQCVKSQKLETIDVKTALPQQKDSLPKSGISREISHPSIEDNYEIHSESTVDQEVDQSIGDLNEDSDESYVEKALNRKRETKTNLKINYRKCVKKTTKSKTNAKLVVKQYKCKYNDCDRVYTNSSSLTHHHKTHQNKSLKCQHSDCPYSTYSKTHMTVHMRTHSKEALFACDYGDCGRRFKDPNGLKSHVVLTHTDAAIVCSIEGCGRRYGNNGNLKRHMRSHSRAPAYPCGRDGCPEVLPSEYHLKRHRMSVHNEKPYNLGIRTVWSCEWPGCDYRTDAKTKLQEHRCLHTGDKLYACEWPECGKQFRLKTVLRDHMNVHQNVKPYACQWPGCQYRCSNSGNLVKHVRHMHQK